MVGKGCFLLAEGMALVKQASPELCGCQTHVKERSISLTCVKPLIDEAGEGEGLSLFQMVLPQRLKTVLNATEKHNDPCCEKQTSAELYASHFHSPSLANPPLDLTGCRNCVGQRSERNNPFIQQSGTKSHKRFCASWLSRSCKVLHKAERE